MLSSTLVHDGYRIRQTQVRQTNQSMIKGGEIRFDYDGGSKEDWTETPRTGFDRRGN